MGSLDQLKQTFFDECSEALQQIENGLPDIRDGAGSDDTINAVFRSVHSVKGGAGIFGFEDLVKFAHVFETVLDEMRSGKLVATEEIVASLLQANDVLTDLIAMSRTGDAIPPDYGSECRAALEQILRATQAASSRKAATHRRRQLILTTWILSRSGWTNLIHRQKSRSLSTASSSGRSRNC